MKWWLAMLWLSLMTEAHAAWVPYGEAEMLGNVYYLDPESIRKSDAGFIVNILSTYPAPIRESFATFQSVQSQVEMDCHNKQLREVFMNFHKQAMGRGRVVHTERGQGDFNTWPPGSLNAILHEVVCE
jgi:hypothetical protein